jgi:hypothetical protein
MGLWGKDYHPMEAYYSLVGTEAAKYLKMEDLEVDDDEWQISAWFLRDQTKPKPIAALDFKQDIFAVSGTFRVQERDEGFIVFSRDHFRDMFGKFPSSFSFDRVAELGVCPYEYQADKKQWSSKHANGHPVVFHFAGNDWLCACTVFIQEGYQGATGKFWDKCHIELEKWLEEVSNGIAAVAKNENATADLFIYKELVNGNGSGLRKLRPKNEDRGPYTEGGPYKATKVAKRDRSNRELLGRRSR